MGTQYKGTKSAHNIIGTEVQAWDDDLDDIAALTPVLGAVMIGDGTNWTADISPTLQGDLTLAAGVDINFSSTSAINVSPFNKVNFVDGTKSFSFTPFTGGMNATNLIGTLTLQVNGTTRMILTATALKAGSTATQDIGSTTVNWRDLFLSRDLFFGSSQSASVSYDATNLVIAPALVGSGYVDIRGEVRAVDEVTAYSNVNTIKYAAMS